MDIERPLSLPYMGSKEWEGNQTGFRALSVPGPVLSIDRLFPAALLRAQGSRVQVEGQRSGHQAVCVSAPSLSLICCDMAETQL